MKIIVLDTETLGVFNPSVYDLGYVVYDSETDNIIKARDYLTSEIFDNANLMKTAYYANKLPIYYQRLADGYCKKTKWSYILRMLKRDMNKYGVDGIYAYNSRFDTRAIAKTCEKLNSKTNPTADGIKDIWKGLTDPHITETEEYKAFCRKNGFMTKHKRPRCQAKAETVFRYLTGQTDYKEEHTALEDSKIELAILLKAWELARAQTEGEEGMQLTFSINQEFTIDLDGESLRQEYDWYRDNYPDWSDTEILEQIYWNYKFVDMDGAIYSSVSPYEVSEILNAKLDLSKDQFISMAREELKLGEDQTEGDGSYDAYQK